MRSTVTLVLAALLCGCAALPSPTTPVPALPAQWHAALPHDGRLADLRGWWQQFDDPLLAELVAAAQDASPTIASARSRIEQARAARVGAGAALGPSLQAQATLSRGREDFGLPIATSGASGLQASWEIDVFGGRRAAADATQARLEGARALWHDARVSVAAEVATSYVGLRACEALLAQTRADAASRGETARLTELSARSGFQSPANAALSRATAAQGQGNATQQHAQCELAVKSLVALTAIAEPELRARLGERTARLPQPAQIAVEAVPGQALAQRPDLFSAARDVEAAAADTAEAQAQRLPRVTLNGSLSAARAKTSSGSTDGTLWSFGPLAVSLPIFDGGARRANVEAARARYDEAASVYRARLRVAVQEVEQALVTLQSTADRTHDAQLAAEGFHASYVATEMRQRGGLASLFELEDARRSDLQAQNALIDLQRERIAAWISLYRALGGGWRADALQIAQGATR
ncbi:efflux transporter outer membrane subunit [Piscinibacter sp. XHJ-5]|uniref:efflux transporter outer membrane subunit n=1 Tax=Piscinibacter sp. XHJ-5 TaxID=3037797 RepID=UPI0024531827|nr:efflux transporter outer membrane subunit [Piscinibacter sp. XHJ-5]